MSVTVRSESRRLRFFLQEFRVLEGLVAVGGGASLTSLLASRKGYVSLTDARWSGSQRPLDHLVLRVDQILWVTAPGGDVPLVNAALAPECAHADLQLAGGLIIRGGLPLASRQRLGDYLDSAGPFLPLHAAVLLRSHHGGKPVGAELGDIAVSQNKIEAAWESVSQAAPDAATPAPES